MLNERAPVFSQTEDATIYLAAKTVLAGLAPVDVACREWAVAVQRLGGASLLDAVEVFQKITPQKVGKKIPELVAEYDASFADDMSPAYRSRVRNRLRRFAARFTKSPRAIWRYEGKAFFAIGPKHPGKVVPKRTATRA